MGGQLWMKTTRELTPTIIYKEKQGLWWHGVRVEYLWGACTSVGYAGVLKGTIEYLGIPKTCEDAEHLVPNTSNILIGRGYSTFRYNG